MANKTIHRAVSGVEDKKVYITDDKDSLPADVKGYEVYTVENFSWVDFMREAFIGEVKGFTYNIQIGDMFYETQEIDD